MVTCLNPSCKEPHSPGNQAYCCHCGAKLAQPYLFKHYRVIDILGEGGFGRTYLVEDTHLYQTKRVLKKLITESRGPNLDKIKELFAREGKQLYQLDHPQIPKLHAYFEEENGFYLVQEYVEGVTLTKECQDKGRFNQWKIREILESILPVLSYIHSNQVLHRDIKPDNIMRRSRDGLIMLIDFGAARVKTATDPSELTAIYTPGYAPMEQIRGRAKASSDIYSLGVTCLRLMTGCLATETTAQIYDEEEERWCYQEYLSKQGVKLTPELTRVLDRMIEESAKQRYQTADEVIKDLQGPKIVLAPPLKPAIVPAPLPKTVVRQPKQIPRSGFLKLMIAAGIGGIGVVAILFG